MRKQIILIGLSLSVGFLTAQTRTEKRNKSKAQSELQYAAIKSLLDSREYKFQADRVLPASGGSITAVNLLNFITLNENEVDGLLPYFGEIRSGNGYGDNGTLQFKGEIENYKVLYKDKKNTVIITFIARNKSERFDITLFAYEEGWAKAVVRSMDRNTISYQGRILPLIVGETSL